VAPLFTRVCVLFDLFVFLMYMIGTWFALTMCDSKIVKVRSSAFEVEYEDGKRPADNNIAGDDKRGIYIHERIMYHMCFQ